MLYVWAHEILFILSLCQSTLFLIFLGNQVKKPSQIWLHCTHKKMKIIFVEIRIFGSKVIFFKFLVYYIDYIVGSTLSFFYQNGPWGGRYHCSKDEH